MLQFHTMDASPKVSVVIPAYNVGRFIDDTLKSVFSQTVTDYEVIVVNDGSPDTEELELVLTSYLEDIVYLKQENLGAGAARNKGLRAARGEFIAFLDGDDLWQPNYLAEQMKFIVDQECDLVCADATLFGELANTNRTYMETLMDSAPARGRVTFLELVNAERCFVTSGIVLRRELIFKVGLFDESLRTAQDFDLWLRLAVYGAHLAYHRNVLLRYRCRPDGLTGDAINSHRRELRIFDKIEQSYDLNPHEREQVLSVIRKRRAVLEFELGKLYLIPGDFARARDSFARSNNLRRAWKPQLALWLARWAPRLLQTCLRQKQRFSA